MPFEGLVPHQADWRAGKHPGEENRNFTCDAEYGKHVHGVPEPSFLQSEDASVKKQDR